jgi:uncharacterized protein (TIGR02588 family)
MAKPEKNALEWSVFAVGLVLVLATLGYLVRESIVSDGGPPDVAVRLGSARPSRHGWLLSVEVTNVGSTTAEDVRVAINLELPDGTRQEAELDIAFLPPESKRQGWVSFRSDPREGTLTLGAIAFEVP